MSVYYSKGSFLVIPIQQKYSVLQRAKYFPDIEDAWAPNISSRSMPSFSLKTVVVFLYKCSHRRWLSSVALMLSLIPALNYCPKRVNWYKNVFCLALYCYCFSASDIIESHTGAKATFQSKCTNRIAVVEAFTGFVGRKACYYFVITMKIAHFG